MKRILLFLSLLLISAYGYAQSYRAEDKNAMQAFLMQDATDGQKNYMHLGFAAEPDWTSEEWYQQLIDDQFIDFVRNTYPYPSTVVKLMNKDKISGTPDFRNMDQLTAIAVNGTSITGINIAGMASLRTLYCQDTNLTLATLPEKEDLPPYTSSVKYAPLNPIDGGTATGWQIDLSAQNRNGNTTYKWYIDGDLNNQLTDITGTDGRFTIPMKYGERTLVCRMTNTDYPQFAANPLVYKATMPQPKYHAADIAALQAFMLQDAADGKKNYEHLGLTTLPDWTSEEWVGSVTGVTWNDATPKQITEIDWTNKSDLKGSFDARNLVKLNMFYCGNTKINALDVSGLSELGTLYCNNTDISDLILTGATGLTVFNCSNTPISELNLSGLTNLYSLYCSNTGISELDVTGLTSLEYLDCSNTNLTLETLPVPSDIAQVTDYTYAPLNEIDGGTTEGEVDLSAQNRNGNTTYKWYSADDLSDAATELGDITGAGGVFTIPSTYANTTLVCKMTNSDFPQFDSNPLTYTVEVSASVSVDKEAILNDRIYVSEGQLCVDVQQEGTLSVYDIAGRLCVNAKLAAGTHIIPLESGTYIVRVNNEQQKIILK